MLFEELDIETERFSNFESPCHPDASLQISAQSDFCLCWGFTAQATQWGHVERSQFT